MTKLRTHIPPPSRPNAWNNPLLPAPPLNQSSSTRAAITDVVTKEIHTGITILEERIQDKFRQMEQELEDYKKQAEEMNRTLVVYGNQSKEVQQTVDGHEKRIKNTETIQTAQQQEIQDIRTDFNLNIESLAHTLTEKMEISEQANDRKLDDLKSTLTAIMDTNQTSLIEDNAAIKTSNTSILAGLQHVLSRLPPEAPAAVAVPVTGPLPAATIAPHQSQATFIRHTVHHDDDSPRKRKSAFEDETATRERLYNKEDDQQHQQQHQHQHQQYRITTLTPDNSQASK